MRLQSGVKGIAFVTASGTVTLPMTSSDTGSTSRATPPQVPKMMLSRIKRGEQYTRVSVEFQRDRHRVEIDHVEVPVAQSAEQAAVGEQWAGVADVASLELGDLFAGC